MTDTHPLDPSALNDLRRRVVRNEEVSDEELLQAINALRLQNRGQLKPPPKKKAAKKATPVDFSDLLATPAEK